MQNKEKIKEIKEILNSLYKGKMSEQTINEFANDLYESVFIEQYDFDDIPAIVFEYETNAGIEKSEWNNIFSSVIDLLDNNEITAKRLYNNFMNEFECLEAFVKLVNENSEYLSKEQLSEVKEKGFELFDKELLRSYGLELK